MTCDQRSEVGNAGLVDAATETSVSRVSCCVIVPSQSRIQWIRSLAKEAAFVDMGPEKVDARRGSVVLAMLCSIEVICIHQNSRIDAYLGLERIGNKESLLPALVTNPVKVPIPNDQGPGKPGLVLGGV